MKKFTITIDGPAGAGKGTVALEFARRHGYVHFDVGLLFRLVAYLAQEITRREVSRVCELFYDSHVTFSVSDGKMQWMIDGEDIQHAHLRVDEISDKTSSLGADQKLFDMVRGVVIHIGDQLPMKVCDGRNTGGVFFPDAEVKCFVTADIRVRVERRHRELQSLGVRCQHDDVLHAMQARDLADRTRRHNPLVAPNGSHHIDTTRMTIDQVVDAIYQIVCKKLACEHK